MAKLLSMGLISLQPLRITQEVHWRCESRVAAVPGESLPGAEPIPKQIAIPQKEQFPFPGSSHALRVMSLREAAGGHPEQSHPSKTAEKFLWAALCQDPKPIKRETRPYYLILASCAAEPEQELRILSSASYSYSIT